MTSPPTTPTKGESRFKPLYTPCEWIEDYTPGGYHPTHFDDIFDNGRYKVIRKLGYGSSSTVWLAVDQKLHGFVALKILTAEASTASSELTIHRHLAGIQSTTGSEHITEMIDHFEHHGPNGVHVCLVFELMGPCVNSMAEFLPWFMPRKRQMKIRYPVWMAKRILKQTLQSLAFLHENGITHGDFQPGNILFTLRDIGNVGEDQLAQDPNFVLGATSPPIERIDGKPDKWAPRYLAVPQPLSSYANIERDFQVRLSDFGGSFFHSNPPKREVTPLGLRPPELILGERVHRSLDIWSFGCILFELIAARPLFYITGGGERDADNDGHLLQLSNVLGPLPDNLYALWARSSNYFHPDRKQFKSFLGEVPEGTDPLSARDPPLEQVFDSVKPSDMTDGEAKSTKVLLRRILQYDPERRPTPSELLEDPWFAD